MVVRMPLSGSKFPRDMEFDDLSTSNIPNISLNSLESSIFSSKIGNFAIRHIPSERNNPNGYHDIFGVGNGGNFCISQ